MKPPTHVGVLMYPGVVLLEAAGVAESLCFANRVAERRGEPPPFIVDYITANGRATKSFSGLRAVPTRAGGHVDVLVVPGFDFISIDDLFERLNRNVISLIQKTAKRGAIWSICNGSFFVAEAGLLDNRSATITWWLGGIFAKRYPKVLLQLDQALVEDGTFVTSGAGTAAMQLAMLLIERFASAELSRIVARLMLIDNASHQQTPFMHAAVPAAYTGIMDDLRDARSDNLVTRARELIGRQLQHPLRIDTLAQQLGITSRTLLRRFRAATKQSPTEYLQAARIERARALLEATKLPIKRILARVGYTDERAFRRLFKNHVGTAMIEYRQRFGFQRAKSTKTRRIAATRPT
jgi:transcriptional regulator GlxA family with amidase domain